MKKSTEETIIIMEQQELVLLSYWIALISVETVCKILKEKIIDNKKEN